MNMLNICAVLLIIIFLIHENNPEKKFPKYRQKPIGKLVLHIITFVSVFYITGFTNATDRR